jgi:hypothetical protein
MSLEELGAKMNWLAVKYDFNFDFELSSVVRYSPETNDMSTEAEISPLLKAVTRKRLVEL